MGFYEDQLRGAVNSQANGDVNKSQTAWLNSAKNLEDVRDKLAAAATTMRYAFGENSELGQQGFESFTKASERAETHRAELDKGHGALQNAAGAMIQAEIFLNGLPDVSPDPGTYTPDPAKDPEEQLKDQTKHNQKASKHADEAAEREEQARRALEKMDTRFEVATQEMKEIHKIPDPPPVPPIEPPGGGGGNDPKPIATPSRRRSREADEPAPRGRRRRRPGRPRSRAPPVWPPVEPPVEPPTVNPPLPTVNPPQPPTTVDPPTGCRRVPVCRRSGHDAALPSTPGGSAWWSRRSRLRHGRARGRRRRCARWPRRPRRCRWRWWCRCRRRPRSGRGCQWHASDRRGRQGLRQRRRPGLERRWSRRDRWPRWWRRLRPRWSSRWHPGCGAGAGGRGGRGAGTAGGRGQAGMSGRGAAGAGRGAPDRRVRPARVAPEPVPEPVGRQRDERDKSRKDDIFDTEKD